MNFLHQSTLSKVLIPEKILAGFIKIKKTAKWALFCMPSNGIELHFLCGWGVYVTSECEHMELNNNNIIHKVLRSWRNCATLTMTGANFRQGLTVIAAL